MFRSFCTSETVRKRRENLKKKKHCGFRRYLCCSVSAARLPLAEVVLTLHLFAETREGMQPLLKGSLSSGRGPPRKMSQYSGCVSPLGSLLEPRELCLVVADNNLKMRNSLLFSALLHIYWHTSTSLQFCSDVCQKIPAGSPYHKPFGTLAPCLTPLQMHLRGELLA